MNRLLVKIILGGGYLFLLQAGILPAQNGPDAAKPALAPAASANILAVSCQQHFLMFTLKDEQVVMVRLMIRDGGGHLVYDSGETAGETAVWDSWTMAMSEQLTYQLQAWDGEGNLVQWRGGEIRPGLAGESPLVVAPFDVTGNFTIGGSLGVGTTTPERAIHLKGANAVFRMDRSLDSTAFMLVRTDTAGAPLKAFVVGVNASSANQGQFVINDLGAAVSGGGLRRMTIENTGAVTFNGNVRADVTSGQAVVGSSTSGDGVTGTSNSTDGVVGITNSTGAGYAGVYASNTGGSIAVYSDGDIYATGAFRGNIGSGGGAPFPRPAWDSGWVGMAQGESKTVYHNLGGYTDDYVVDMQISGASGRMMSYFDTYLSSGAEWYNLTNTAINVHRNSSDQDATQIRILIWVFR